MTSSGYPVPTLGAMKLRSAIGLVLALAACGEADPPVQTAPRPFTPVQPLEAEVVVAIPAETELRLLDPGGKSRATLRFDVAPGSMQTVRIETRTSGTLTVDGRPVETSSPLVGTRLEMAVTAGETDEAGALELAFAITAAEPIFKGEAPPAQVESFRRMLGAGVGISGTLVRDARGLCTVTSVAAPPGALGPKPPGVEESIQQSMDVISVPVPAEPVGIGARWEVVSPQVRSGAEVRMTRTYELIHRDARRVVLEVVVQQAANPGPIAMPGMDQSASARLTRLVASGTGRVDARLTDIVPERATLSLDGEGVFRISDDQNITVMRRETHMEFVIEAE